MKSKRQELIRRLLADGVAMRQEDLVAALSSRGEAVTQATVSRDLREMGVVKSAEGYRLASKPVSEAYAEGSELARAAREYVLEVEPAGTLAVVRTGAGQASALALRLDRSGWRDIVGTVAGDDTVFVATRSAADAKRIAELLGRMSRGRSGEKER